MIDLEKTPVNELLGKKVHYIRYPYKAESGICVGINKKSKGTLTMTADRLISHKHTMLLIEVGSDGEFVNKEVRDVFLTKIEAVEHLKRNVNQL